MPFAFVSSTVVDVYLASAVAAVTTACAVAASAAAADVARSLIAVAARALYEGHARGLLAPWTLETSRSCLPNRLEFFCFYRIFTQRERLQDAVGS